MKICKLENCNNKIKSRSWCQKHYTRNRRYGDPLIIKRREPNLSELELLKWMKSVPQRRVSLKTKCWEWMGTRTKNGYGQIQYKGKKILIHRLMWFLTWGYMPKKLILHSCDNPSCFNPDHLSEGTQQDNMDDKVKRNRQAKGEKQGLSKLTEKKVIAIKKKYKSGRYNQTELGERFGVSHAAICRIINRKTWKHL